MLFLRSSHRARTGRHTNETKRNERIEPESERERKRHGERTHKECRSFLLHPHIETGWWICVLSVRLLLLLLLLFCLFYILYYTFTFIDRVWAKFYFECREAHKAHISRSGGGGSLAFAPALSFGRTCIARWNKQNSAAAAQQLSLSFIEWILLFCFFFRLFICRFLHLFRETRARTAAAAAAFFIRSFDFISFRFCVWPLLLLLPFFFLVISLMYK